MSHFPYRRRSVACIHPDTYKYFLDPALVDEVWQRLETRYGPPQRNEAFRTIDVETPHFFLRAVIGGNPITLIRKRSCPIEAIDECHELLRYQSKTKMTSPMTEIDTDALTPAALLVTDSEQCVVTVSTRFLALFGCEESDVLGTTFDEFIFRKDRKGKSDYVTALSTYEDGYIDVKLVLEVAGEQAFTRVRACRSGDSGWCFFVESLGTTPGDKFYDLVLGQERWRAVMAPSDDGIAILNADNELVEFNSSFMQLADIRSEHGVLLNEESLDGRELFSLLSEDPQFKPVEDVVALSRTKKKKKFRGVVLRSNRYIELSTTPIHLPVKGFSGTAITLHDVTAQKELQAASIEIARKNADISAILENLKQGVFTILPDSTVHSEYSAHLETLLNTNEIAGVDALDLLFQNAMGPRGQRDAVESVLLCLGGDFLFFEVNSHILPHEVTYEFDGQKQIVQLDWSAILSSDEIVEKILVSLRDVTELRRLEQERNEQEDKMRAIMMLTSVSSLEFMDFYIDAESMLQKLEHAIDIHKKPNVNEIEEIFRNCHTIKGNSRILGFNKVAEHAHEAEHHLGELRENPASTWDGQTVAAHVADIRSSLDFLCHIERDVLQRGIADETRLGEAVLNASTLEQLLSSVSEADSHMSQLQELTTQLRLMTSCLLEEITSQAVVGIASVAAQLDKPTPTVSFRNDQSLRLSGVVAKPLHNMFVHMFNNSMDHGIEAPNSRVAAGKPKHGQLSIAIRQEGDHAEITFADDGQGLDLELLRRKYDVGELCDEEVAALILDSGTTSRDRATMISGRGVGMDAVRRMAQEFGGDVRVRLSDATSDATSEAHGHRPFSLIVDVPNRFVAPAPPQAE